MYQHVVIVGHLGRAPEMRYTANGTPVANFSVATNRRWTDNEGNAQEETTWFRVSVWGRQAEVCNQYLDKGRLVLVDGDIRTSQYQDKDGATRDSWELRAINIKFLSGPGDRNAASGFDQSAEGAGPASTGGSGAGAAHGNNRNSAPAPAGAALSEDDIPF